MTPQMRMALSELAFAFAEVQAIAAQYEQNRSPTYAEQMKRRLKQLQQQVGIVSFAVGQDVRVEVLPMDRREAEPPAAA